MTDIEQCIPSLNIIFNIPLWAPKMNRSNTKPGFLRGICHIPSKCPWNPIKSPSNRMKSQSSPINSHELNPILNPQKIPAKKQFNLSWSVYSPSTTSNISLLPFSPKGSVDKGQGYFSAEKLRLVLYLGVGWWVLGAQLRLQVGITMVINIQQIPK
jgi:hypothetical protein